MLSESRDPHEHDQPRVAPARTVHPLPPCVRARSPLLDLARRRARRNRILQTRARHRVRLGPRDGDNASVDSRAIQLLVAVLSHPVNNGEGLLEIQDDGQLIQ